MVEALVVGATVGWSSFEGFSIDAVVAEVAEVPVDAVVLWVLVGASIADMGITVISILSTIPHG
eukprot:8015160-Prorocentrum_lima.AAC.1